MMSKDSAVRAAWLPVALFVSGLILLVGGIAAFAIAHASAASRTVTGAMQTLPVNTYTDYKFPPLSSVDPYALQHHLMPVFLAVAMLGLIVLSLAAVLRAVGTRGSQRPSS